jgi:hypothetical protein
MSGESAGYDHSQCSVEWGSRTGRRLQPVIPAEAGIQGIPCAAGLDPGFRRGVGAK